MFNVKSMIITLAKFIVTGFMYLHVERDEKNRMK